MKRILIFLSFAVVSFVSCNRYRVPDSNAETIDLNFNGKGLKVPFRMSQMVDSVTYLAVDDSIKIGFVKDIHYCNGLYFLLDKSNSSIVVVNEEGHIESVISKQGRAKGEYLSLEMFDVNPSNNEISVYDQAGNKMLVYSTTGEYLRDFVVDRSVEYYRSFSVLPNGDYVCYNPDYQEDKSYHRGVWIVNKDGLFVKQLASCESDYKMHNPVYDTHFSRLTDGTVCIMSDSDKDNVYHVSCGGDITTAYHFKSDVKMPLSMTSNDGMLSDVELMSPLHYLIIRYIETDNWIIAGAVNGRKYMNVFYDKINQKNYTIHSDNDIIYDIPFLLSENRTFGNCCLSCIDNLEAQPQHVRDMFPNRTDDSNPIIQKVYVK